MFGYATRETPELMPMPISLAHKLAQRLAEVRKGDVVPYLRPDGKTQVTVRYENGVPIQVEKVLISTQHKDGVDCDSLIRPDLWEHILHPILPGELAKGLELLAAGTDIDYQGATAVDLVGDGESAGSYREVEFTGGEVVTTRFR